MSHELETAVSKLKWGSRQRDFSTDLTPEECAALLEIVEKKSRPRRKERA